MNIEPEKQIKDSGQEMVFSLDIGTRSIIGIVGIVEDEKFKVLAIEKEEHTNRAMVDGQIENIDQVAHVARIVKERLEKKLSCALTKVCVAAAGRALKTEKASFELSMPEIRQVDEETISRLETGAIGNAEASFTNDEGEKNERQFYLVGYTVSQYYLDNYPISSLKNHRGKNLRADVVATFLPSEVVESLYITMNNIGLEVASLTLEPIAAINAAIPQKIRLLNLALVDIGAGTSDIAVCKDGSVIGYTMATIAGDEITETIMKHHLVDFDTAEKIKFELSGKKKISFVDIMGLKHSVSIKEILLCITEAKQKLCREIADRILEVNNGQPSAVFLAGGGSKLTGMCKQIAGYLNIDESRVAIAGNNFQLSAFAEEYDINNPEYATPLGIAISAGMNLINDSFRVTLNGANAKLFRSGSLSVRDILMMNGFGYQDLIGRSGSNLVVSLDSKRTVVYGGLSMPAVLKINGSEAKISDIIHAGDVIEFQPAKHGEAAKACVGDVVEDYGQTIFVNEVIADMNTTLKTGDVIVNIGDKKTLALEENISEDNAKEDSVENKDIVKKEKEIFVTTEGAEDKRNHDEIKIGEPKIPVKFTINNKPITFLPKDNKEPYYLMDMLEHSGIDFDHPDGNVVLKVNGEDGYFQQQLNSGDVIEIFCEKI
ncbi:MAG: cell division FtsA domain-containing protein [Lachnospiraceae bacterium]|nr:cell division FtsA domain-containing protein [Lachnospiraceae bacterium]